MDLSLCVCEFKASQFQDSQSSMMRLHLKNKPTDRPFANKLVASKNIRGSEVVQQVKVSTTKPDLLRSSPKSHMSRRRKLILVICPLTSTSAVLWHGGATACHVFMHKHTLINKHISQGTSSCS